MFSVSLALILSRKFVCRVTQNVSHYQIIRSYYIVLKPANEIRLISLIKVSIKHYNIIR